MSIQPASNRDFHTTITVNASPQQAFQAINRVSQWWTQSAKGDSRQLGDEFTVRFGDIHYSKQKIVEFIPDRKVVWLVTASKLSFVDDKEEWTNTKISFEISGDNGKTQVHFGHIGLHPTIECYEGCSTAWSQLIRGSLQPLIEKGIGKPDVLD